jgi:hypothetical protein
MAIGEIEDITADEGENASAVALKLAGRWCLILKVFGAGVLLVVHPSRAGASNGS